MKVHKCKSCEQAARETYEQYLPSVPKWKASDSTWLQRYADLIESGFDAWFAEEYEESVQCNCGARCPRKCKGCSACQCHLCKVCGEACNCGVAPCVGCGCEDSGELDAPF